MKPLEFTEVLECKGFKCILDELERFSSGWWETFYDQAGHDYMDDPVFDADTTEKRIEDRFDLFWNDDIDNPKSKEEVKGVYIDYYTGVVDLAVQYKNLANDLKKCCNFDDALELIRTVRFVEEDINQSEHCLELEDFIESELLFDSDRYFILDLEEDDEHACYICEAKDAASIFVNKLKNNTSWHKDYKNMPIFMYDDIVDKEKVPVIKDNITKREIEWLEIWQCSLKDEFYGGLARLVRISSSELKLGKP